MGTTIGTETTVGNTLKNLAALEYDTAASYRSAAERIDPSIGNAKVLELVRKHEERAQGLAPIIRGFGERPPRAGDLRQLKTQGKVVAAGVVGQRAVFEAMIENERDVHEAYERAAARPDVVGNLAIVLRQYRDDAEANYEELASRLTQID